jgi:hypothetical protein
MSTDTSEAVESAAHWGSGLETLSPRVEGQVANAALEHGCTVAGGITDPVGGGCMFRTPA